MRTTWDLRLTATSTEIPTGVRVELGHDPVEHEVCLFVTGLPLGSSNEIVSSPDCQRIEPNATPEPNAPGFVLGLLVLAVVARRRRAGR